MTARQRARSVSAAGARALCRALALLLPLASAANAQDALRGKRLFLDTARLTGSGVSCVDCHGGLPPGLFGIGRAANDPALVERAVNAIPQMTPLRGRLGANDYADLAAYIGNPAVPSPVLRGATSGAATTTNPERLDFGAAKPGSQTPGSRWHLVNEGAVAVRLTAAPLLRGDHAGDFAVVSGDCVAGLTLAGGISCSMEIVFRPQAGVGTRQAAVAVAHDWVGGEIALALGGQAAAPAAPPPVADGGGGGAAGLTASLLLLALAASRACSARRRADVGRQGAARRHPPLDGRDESFAVPGRNQQAPAAAVVDPDPVQR